MTILSESLKDIKQDFQELIELYHSYHTKLKDYAVQLDKKKTYITSLECKRIKIDINHFETIISKTIKEIRALQISKKSLELKKQKKEEYYVQLRNIVGLIGNLLVATEFQSPSIDYTLQSQAGIQTEMIKQSSFDYKRDQHWNQKKYEAQFIKEYIFNFIKYPIFSYTTSSGMSALTSILTFLSLYKKINGTILLGSSSYFETKIMIHSLYSRVIEFDEENDEKFKQLIRIHKPDALFVDSLSNSYELKKPNLERLLKICIKELKKDMYVIVDNTSLSLSFQPFKYIIGKTKYVHLILWESLNKFHQFGLDRVTGGIIYGVGKDVSELFYGREHAGTNIPDATLATLPSPHRKTLHNRLKRIYRNSQYLYDHLKDIIDISYVAESPYLILHLPSDKQDMKSHQIWIENLLELSRKQNIPLIYGTSFGLNTTRVYVAGVNDEKGKLFLRVSPGTETLLEIEKIEKVMREVIYLY